MRTSIGVGLGISEDYSKFSSSLLLTVYFSVIHNEIVISMTIITSIFKNMPMLTLQTTPRNMIRTNSKPWKFIEMKSNKGQYFFKLYIVSSNFFLLISLSLVSFTNNFLM